MSDIDPRLVAAAISEVESVTRETGENLSIEDVVKATLGLFEIHDEFRVDLITDITREDDPSIPVCQSAEQLLEEMKAHPAPSGQYRDLWHRWVGTTNWENARARIDWDYR